MDTSEHNHIPTSTTNEPDSARLHGLPAKIQMETYASKNGRELVGNYLTVLEAGGGITSNDDGRLC